MNTNSLLNNFSKIAPILMVAVAITAVGGYQLMDDSSSISDSSEANLQSPVEYKGVMTLEHERYNEETGEYETIAEYEDENLIVDQGLEFFQCQSAGHDQVRWYDESEADDAGFEWGEDNIDTRYSGESYEVQLFTTAEDANCPEATTAGSATNTDNAYYISLSGDDTSPSAGWEQLDNEITSGGLERTRGTVVDEATGHYSVEFTFVAESDFDEEDIPGSDNIQTTGLHWSGNNGDDDLVAANSFPGVTMLQGDRLTISWEEVSFSTS